MNYIIKTENIENNRIIEFMVESNCRTWFYIQVSVRQRGKNTNVTYTFLLFCIETEKSVRSS